MLESNALLKASTAYGEIAILWKEVSDIFIKIRDTPDMVYVDVASELFIELSQREKATMEKLKEPSTL